VESARADAHRRITITEAAAEPFRLFFPVAALIGVLGVLLWPLHFAGIVSSYPGQVHARVMVYGLFGGFIFGFLGTALPRMLSANPLTVNEVAVLFAIYAGMIASYIFARLTGGDILLILLLGSLVIIAFRRLSSRKDMPPPGFVLVPLAFACAIAGAALGILVPPSEDSIFWATLQKLLAYQGFVLFPILGIGGFLLPRFFGMPSRQDLAESRTPPPGWFTRATLALCVGLLILASFGLEAAGWYRCGPALRFITTLSYLMIEIPVFKPLRSKNALTKSLRVAFAMLIGGFLSVALWPEYRVALLHLTLMGGFAVLTFTVATRVVFGHSGNQHRLTAPNRWLLVAVGLMLLAMATRISGDLWPKVLVSHYVYGAVIWVAGVVLWGLYVLPNVRRRDVE
jgi:uncharacterized protein involved in response to NO